MMDGGGDGLGSYAVEPVVPGTKETLQFRVSDVRQHIYCPRITYLNYVIPVPRRKTVKMEAGKESHADFSEIEKRRTLAKYRLGEGQREFWLRLESLRLGLGGVLDMLITTRLGTYPVEFKNTSGDMGLHHKYQLAAYAMLVEEVLQKPVREGFIYLIPGKRVFTVRVDANVRLHVRRVVGAMRNIVRRGLLPARTRSGGRCHDCEFRNYCRDA